MNIEADHSKNKQMIASERFVESRFAFMYK